MKKLDEGTKLSNILKRNTCMVGEHHVAMLSTNYVSAFYMDCVLMVGPI